MLSFLYMKNVFIKNHNFIDLLIGMTQKEIKARYKRTIFGFLWIFINPVLQMMVIGFIFKYFIKQPINNYNYFLFSGLLIWNFFTISLTKATPSIIHERTLVKKAQFPRSVIPLSIVLSNFIHFLIGLIIFFIPLYLIHSPFIARILSVIISVLLLFIFTTGLSLLTSALNVRYRDINFFVQAILIIWFYATPIVYSLSLVPEEVHWLWYLNPLTSSVQLLQYSFVNGDYPSSTTILTNFIIILIICVTGFIVFFRESQIFDDLI